MEPSTINIVAAIGAFLSGISTLAGIFIAYKVHSNQKLLAQRQLILPLWEYISTLNKIDHKNPITPDVVKTVNTLELVAICCEGGMIDESVIRRTFKDQFMDHYTSIEKCTSLPGLSTDGKELLKQNKAAVLFYNSLNIEALGTDKLSK